MEQRLTNCYNLSTVLVASRSLWNGAGRGCRMATERQQRVLFSWTIPHDYATETILLVASSRRDYGRPLTGYRPRYGPAVGVRAQRLRARYAYGRIPGHVHR